MATSTGMSAILLMALTMPAQGRRPCGLSQSMFGSTIKLLGAEMARFGIETTFVRRPMWRPGRRDPPEHAPAVRRDAHQPAHRPVRHRALADHRPRPRRVAGGGQQPLPRPCCSARPGEPDIVDALGTKLLDGQGRVMAGALCASGGWWTGHGRLMRSWRAEPGPFNAWVVLKGLETLSLRVKAQSAARWNCAAWLEKQPKVARRLSRPEPATRSTGWHAPDGHGRRRRGHSTWRAGAEQLRANAFHVIDSTALLHHRQPGRREDHHHPARPAPRTAA